MSDARDEFYIKSMTQRTKDIDDAYDRIRDLEARNAELERENHRGNVLVHDLAAENEMLRQANLAGKPAFLRQIDTDSQKRAEAAEARVEVLTEALMAIEEATRPYPGPGSLWHVASAALQAVAREEKP